MSHELKNRWHSVLMADSDLIERAKKVITFFDTLNSNIAPEVNTSDWLLASEVAFQWVTDLNYDSHIADFSPYILVCRLLYFEDEREKVFDKVEDLIEILEDFKKISDKMTSKGCSRLPWKIFNGFPCDKNKEVKK